MTPKQFEQKLAVRKRYIANQVVFARRKSEEAFKLLTEAFEHMEEARHEEQRIQAFIEENRGAT